jgi:hypothetical protein
VSVHRRARRSGLYYSGNEKLPSHMRIASPAPRESGHRRGAAGTDERLFVDVFLVGTCFGGWVLGAGKSSFRPRNASPNIERARRRGIPRRRVFTLWTPRARHCERPPTKLGASLA